MRERPTALRLIAVGLAVYGVYIAGHVPAMLIGRPTFVLVVGFVLQAVCALAAAFGVWRGRPWAAGMMVALGVMIAATWLVEGFVLGIAPYMHALLIAVTAVVVAVILAAYVSRD